MCSWYQLFLNGIDSRKQTLSWSRLQTKPKVTKTWFCLTEHVSWWHVLKQMSFLLCSRNWNCYCGKKSFEVTHKKTFGNFFSSMFVPDVAETCFWLCFNGQRKFVIRNHKKKDPSYSTIPREDSFPNMMHSNAEHLTHAILKRFS